MPLQGITVSPSRRLTAQNGSAAMDMTNPLATRTAPDARAAAPPPPQGHDAGPASPKPPAEAASINRITLVGEPASAPAAAAAAPTSAAPTTRLSRPCVRWRWTTLRLVLLAIYLLSGTSNTLLWGVYLARSDPKSTLPGGDRVRYMALTASVSEALRLVYMLVVSRQ